MATEQDPRRPVDLADPSTALISYLDDLLQTATSAAAVEAPSATVPVTEAPVQNARVQEALVQESRVQHDPAPPAAPPVAPEARLAEPQPVVAAAEPVAGQKAEAPVVATAPGPEGRPEWAGAPFECLLFRVAGLQLAVPLVLLGAIHRIEDRIKPIPGRPPWYMGMLPDRGVNLKVVDSARWIMPGRAPEDAHERYRFVIRLDDSDWSLACDGVAESFTLDPNQVRWRTSRSKRPWLAGTVVQHMCALIDVGAMARLLAQAEKSQHLDL